MESLPADLVPLRDVAGRLKVKPDTLSKWIRTGKMLGYRVGGVWRVSETDVAELVTPSREATRDQTEAIIAASREHKRDLAALKRMGLL